ncbi:MAG: rhomboid family intramembrane serine protease [Parasphingorhabdus sp.]|nr:rhomboid family intramembrane serine protease [Parasphingorhabdus sp.]
MTKTLILANLAIFLLLLVTGLSQLAAIKGGMFPARFTVGDAPLAQFTPLVPFWLTPLTSAFQHGGWMHLLFNMLMLVFCGSFVEQALGSRLTALLYVTGAYAATLAEILFNGESFVPVIGASGAISAIVAAYALLYSRGTVSAIGPFSGATVRVMWLAAAWIGIQLMIGFAGTGELANIAIWSHIGGFIAGLALTKPLLMFRFRSA